MAATVAALAARMTIMDILAGWCLCGTPGISHAGTDRRAGCRSPGRKMVFQHPHRGEQAGRDSRPSHEVTFTKCMYRAKAARRVQRIRFGKSWRRADTVKLGAVVPAQRRSGRDDWSG